MEKIIEALTERAWLAVVVLGALVFIIGAAGGMTIQNTSLQVADWGGRVALVTLGFLVIAAGLLSLRQEQNSPINRRSYTKYGIRIEHPVNNHTVHGGFVEITGCYKRKPPGKSLRLFVLAEDRVRYWPHHIVEQFDEDNRKWFAHVSLEGGSGEKYGVYIVAALVGQAGAILWDYYYKVGTSKDVWEPLNPLPPDVIECDEIYIIKHS